MLFHACEIGIAINEQRSERTRHASDCVGLGEMINFKSVLLNTFKDSGFGLLGSFPALGESMVYRSDGLLPNISVNGSQPQKLRITAAVQSLWRKN
jgi:hypothetical protein